MPKLTVKYLLGVYKTRLHMQNEGITNPEKKIHELTKQIVEILTNMHPDQELKSENNILLDLNNNIIAMMPKE